MASSVFSKKVAIVTGASSGIGEAIALMFASRGAKVTVCGRDQERLKAVFDQAVEVSGGHTDMFLTVQGDLKNEKIRKEIIDQTVEKFGCLDILVTNAGAVQSPQSVMIATENTYNLIMDTNLKSVFFLIQQAVPHLEKSKGNIVSISSSITANVCPTTTIYSVSKIAIDHLTKCLAVDLGPKGIRVNVVNPGFMPTRIFRYLGDRTCLVNSRVVNNELSKHILREKHLIMEDVTEAVAFLASDAAGFVTGESIKVDGGRSFTGPPIWKQQDGSSNQQM